MPDQYRDVQWYGRGPEESYWDRKSGSPIGRYAGLIEDQFHRYSRPQETGNKTDVRWIQVSSNELTLTAIPTDGQLLSSSTWPFLVDQFSCCKV